TFLLGFFMVYLAYLAFAEVSFSGKRMEYSVIGIMAVICIVETGYNASVCIEGLGNQFGYMDISEYTSFYEKTSPLTELAKSEDDGLYRMDKDYFFSLNDSMLLGYHSLTHYSSTYNAMINATTPRLGLAQTWFWNSGFGATPLVDSLLGVKYRMATKIVPEVYEEVAKSGDVTLYKNPLVLPFCFPAKEACFDLNELSGDVFQNQNSLLSALTGEGREYLTPQEYTRDDQDANVTLSFAAGSDQPMYLYMHATGGSWGEIYVNGQFVNKYFSSETTCAVYMGTFSLGERVSVEVRSENASFDAAWIAALHMTELKEALEKLRGGAIQIESHRGGSLSGTIEVGEGECIATSIPFEKGYTVKIDGKKVPYESYLGTFLAIRTSPGKHTLSLSFSPPGFKTGLLLSGIAICIMGFYFAGAGEILDRLKKSGNRMKRNGGAV
ncbi:MAG: YfhO family protein, partial [Lachnospiraceae bacterium]|nr:YfhO family protein [Lachnospiraceae bacterium]